MNTLNLEIGSILYRVSSYYWIGMEYEVVEIKEGQTLCKIVGSKSTPKWIKNEQLSNTPKAKEDFK